MENKSYEEDFSNVHNDDGGNGNLCQGHQDHSVHHNPTDAL